MFRSYDTLIKGKHFVIILNYDQELLIWKPSEQLQKISSMAYSHVNSLLAKPNANDPQIDLATSCLSSPKDSKGSGSSTGGESISPALSAWL